MAEMLKLSRGSVAQSEGVTGMFSAAGVFEHSDVGMASAGEKAGRLPEALSNIARIYEQRAEGQRIMAHVLAISLMNSSIIALTGWAMIQQALTGSRSIYKLMGF
jgi:type II secretory pathway component PulF